VLSSAVPFLGDVLALRRVPTGFFGVFMSVNPVLAAFIGLLVLGQQLQWEEWLAIVVIVSANAVSAGTAARAATPPPEGRSARSWLRRPARAARPVPVGAASAVPAAQSAAAAHASAGSTAARPRPQGH
jgi:drug/metabolite transporter (DMT)-like permease